MTSRGRRSARHAMGLVKVRFPLEPGQWGDLEAENLWAERVDSILYRIRSVPFFVYGVSEGDVIRANEVNGVLTFLEVAEPGGYSTYRLLIPKGQSVNGRKFLRFWSPLERLGCSFELSKKTWISISVPPSSIVTQVVDLLEKGQAEAAWRFYEEANLEHPVAQT